MMEDKTYNSEILAGDILLLYHQDINDEQEDPFDIDFFLRQVSDAYANILRQQYIDMYKMLRQDGGIFANIVTFDQQWQKKITVDIVEDEERGLYKADTSGINVMTFPYDESSVGIQAVRPLKFGSCKMGRAKRSIENKMDFLPETPYTFFWPEVGVIYFTKPCCKTVEVLYVPTLEPQTTIEPGVADLIKDAVLARVLGASKGQLADKTNDSNPNRLPQSEINKQTLSE